MKSVINFLSATVLFLCTPSLLLASDGNNDNNSEEATEKKNELAENFPFSKSESPIEKDRVAGLRIEEGKITFNSEKCPNIVSSIPAKWAKNDLA